MKRAFTLIELLVVIAIIAILAAILFPVFAQAKASAKKIAVLSQYKQSGTSLAIYLGDADDTAIMGSYSAVGTTITTPAGNTISNPTYSWGQLMNPYMKNYPVMNDKSVQDPIGSWSAAYTSGGWWYNWTRWPALGYNVNYLNNAGGDCSGWMGGTPAVPGITQFGRPISMTAIASPSATVLFESAKRVGTSTGAYLSNVVESPGSYNANDTCSWSNGGWGIGSYGDSAGLYPGNPTSTGDFATPYANQGIIVFTDSSAKSLPAGKVAAGTNWKVGIANSAIQITDRSQYIWDTQQ